MTNRELLYIHVSLLKKQNRQVQVPPRFELGSLDSKSRVLTITPWDLAEVLDPV